MAKIENIEKIDSKAQALREEITTRFGFFPPFFEPALCSFETLNNLWTQTNNSYLNNPMPAVFKEKLAAVLGKYCSIPYCLVVHSCTLRPMGLTAKSVLDLLDLPKFQKSHNVLCVERLKSLPTAMDFPKDSDISAAYILDAAVVLFNDNHSKEISRELDRVLGENVFGNLTLFLSYNYMCHRWVEAHPTLDYRLDKRSIDNLDHLLAEQPSLNNFFKSFDHYAEEEVIEREKEALDAELAHLFDTIPTAVCVLDDRLKLVRSNKAFRRLSGVKSDEYEDSSLVELARLQLSSTKSSEDCSLELASSNGKTLRLSATSSRIYVGSKTFVLIVLMEQKI